MCLNESTDDCLSTVVLACLGFLSPANRGALMTCAVVLWVLLGTPAGYVSARLYKSKSPVKTSLNSWHVVFLIMIFSSIFVYIFSFWRWKVEDKCLADSTLVPRVSSLAKFSWFLFFCLIFVRQLRPWVLEWHVAPYMPSHVPWTLLLSLWHVLSFTVPLSFVRLSAVVLCLQTSSWWTWSFGWRVPQQQSLLALWWPFWPCGLESLCLSPSLVPTLDSRNLWVRPPSLLICLSWNYWLQIKSNRDWLRLNVIPSSIFLCLCRQLSNQCEQTRSPVKFLSSLSLQNLFLV